MRRGIHLRGYAQKNPKQEYKREAFVMFTDMLESIKSEVISTLCTIQVQAQSDVAAVEEQRRRDATMTNVRYIHAETNAMAATAEEEPAQPIMPVPIETYVRSEPKVGRNDPCPCGSGKKFKQCHGQLNS